MGISHIQWTWFYITLIIHYIYTHLYTMHLFGCWILVLSAKEHSFKWILIGIRNRCQELWMLTGSSTKTINIVLNANRLNTYTKQIIAVKELEY